MIEHMGWCGLMDKAPPSQRVPVSPRVLLCRDMRRVCAQDCSHRLSLSHPVKGAAVRGMAAWICLTHAPRINIPRHDPGSWAVLGDRVPAKLGMTVPAHAQGHAGPAWSPPGGFEPTIPGLEVRRRIHDAKGVAMLERL